MVRKCFEITAACGIFTAAALVIVIAGGWHPLFSIPIGVVCSAILYKPQEVWRAACSRFFGKTSAEMSSVIGAMARPVGVVMYWLLGLTSCAALPLALLLCAWIYGLAVPTKLDAYAACIFLACVGGAFAAGMGLMLVYLVPYSDNKNRDHCVLPIIRTLEARASWGGEINPSGAAAPKWWDWTVGERLAFTTIKIPLFQACGIVLLAIFFADSILTAFILLAKTERMAVASGTALGCLAGSAMLLSGELSNPLGALAIGIMTGMVTGPHLYLMATWLALPAHPRTAATAA